MLIIIINIIIQIFTNIFVWSFKNIIAVNLTIFFWMSCLNFAEFISEVTHCVHLITSTRDYGDVVLSRLPLPNTPGLLYPDRVNWITFLIRT